MAVDVFTSPRISFSRELEELDSGPVENHNRRSDSLLSNPTVDFDFGFCIGRDFTHKISSADELFANGQILPVEIKRNAHPPDPIRKKDDVSKKKKKKRLIEFLSSDHEEDELDRERSSNPKPFWQFGRSSSARGEKGRANGLLRLRPLQFLTRSQSTGSVPNPKPTGFSKPIPKQHSLREGSVNHRCNQYYYYPYSNNNNNNINTTSQRPSLRKSNGVRINPVLNIPPAKGTVTLFASFLCAKHSYKR